MTIPPGRVGMSPFPSPTSLCARVGRVSIGLGNGEFRPRMEAGRTALRQRGYPALDPPFRSDRKEGPW